ncbi:MAG: prephenate dehydrogenase/arogenate dehydrogenase family protein, partial [Acidiferrobacterales bacterium]|nr:prephenate dehydrogenase/arogenate dehydrogenase family protein [Acidiferrobacterales bacterium]
LRRGGHVGEVVGFGRSLGTLQKAVDLKVIDRAAVSVADAAQGADMIVVAIPVGSMKAIFAQLAPALVGGAVLTDVGSVKGTVVDVAREAFGSRFGAFVPGHPIAGTEHSGVAASNADLFDKHRVILTPESETDETAVARVRAMWEATGAKVTLLSIEQHDAVLAACSHLPHMLAYALVDMLVRRDDHRLTFDLAAGGFRDFTRIASSDPVMWRDICLANDKLIVELLRDFRDNLDALTDAITRRDSEWLMQTFERAKHARDAYVKREE